MVVIREKRTLRAFRRVPTRRIARCPAACVFLDEGDFLSSDCGSVGTEDEEDVSCLPVSRRRQGSQRYKSHLAMIPFVNKVFNGVNRCQNIPVSKEPNMLTF